MEQMRLVCQNELNFLNFIKNNKELLDWEVISKYKKLNIHMINDNLDLPWDWITISHHLECLFNERLDEIKYFIHPNPYNEDTNKTIIKKYDDDIVEFITKHKDKLNWYAVTNSNIIDYNIINNNKNLPWKWEIISKNINNLFSRHLNIVEPNYHYYD
jgi:hypothetical protein